MGRFRFGSGAKPTFPFCFGPKSSWVKDRIAQHASLVDKGLSTFVQASESVAAGPRGDRKLFRAGSRASGPGFGWILVWKASTSA